MKIASFFFVFLFFVPLVLIGNVDVVKAGRFSEGDRDPPVFCRQVQDPNLVKKRNGFSATSLLVSEAQYNENTLIILAVPSDKEDGTDFSEKEKEAREAVLDGENSAKNYFLEISGNIMELKGYVFKEWVILPKTAEEYGVDDIDKFNNKEILKAVIETVDGSIDFRDYGRIIIFTRGQHNFAYSSVGQWSNIETDDGELSLSICWIGEEDIGSRYLLRHEIFHTEGAEHSGSVVLGNDDSCDRLCLTQDITKGENGEWPPVKCTTYEYWNPWDIMGNGDCYTFMYNLDKLWPDETRVYAPKESGYVTLIPRSSSKEGFKMIRFEGKDNQGSKMTIYAEYYARVEGTFDISGDKSYVLLYFTDEDGLLNGDSAILFREEGEKEGSITYLPLNLKETPFCDSRNGIKIELLSEDGNEAELYITLSCEEKSPSISVSPDYIQTMAGENVFSEISVSNEMALGCGTRTVNVEAILPDANWSATFSPSSTLELGPGEAGTITAVIQITESAPANSYGLAFKATDQDSGLSGEASATIEVLQPPPIPTPIPTIPNEEMILSVTINGIDPTTDNIVVAKKSWVNVAVVARNSGGEILQADKITCALTKSNGKRVYRNNANGIFRFKAGRRGKYILEVEAFKNGFQKASFQTSFKVK